METEPLHACFDEFELPESIPSSEATVAIPTSNGMQQRYFFLNMKTRKGLRINYPSRGGLATTDSFKFLSHLCDFVKNPEHKYFGKIRPFFRRYHNGISFLELLYKVSKPHGITYLDDQKYLVSLWSSSTYFVIDLKKNSIEQQMLDQERAEVFSTYQYYVPETKESYFATQLGEHEWHKHDKEDIYFDVPVKIKKYNWETDTVSEIWSGDFDTDTHFLALNQDRRYLGLMQFGDFFGENGGLLPSKILILDLQNGKEWRISNEGWSPTAHIDWDPVDPNVCYLSNHQGVIVPVDSRLRFFLEKTYKWRIFGPAAVHRYEMTPEGPQATGVFTHPELIRLTIHKVFVHRDQKLISCTGFPNFVFIADADSMNYVRKVDIREADGTKSVVGSLYPSPDGEKVYMITTHSFQILDVATGEVEHIEELGRIYDPFNHMISVSATEW